MNRPVPNGSLRFQVLALCVASMLVTATGAVWAVVSHGSDDLIRRTAATTLATSAVAIAIAATASGRMLKPFDLLTAQLLDASKEHAASKEKLARRTQTVDRLLEFSQTIQGVGTSEAIFATLVHYLRVELDLAGVALITSHPEQTPSTQLKISWPNTLLHPAAGGDATSVSEMDGSGCPCLRQNLPRQFKFDGAPVRCAIDQCITLANSHPAYCVPFTIALKTTVLVHMLLPEQACWTESRRQLAQSYCNTACASLMSLHLLQEAEKQSLTDALTNLYNRRSMEQLMQREVALADRHGHALSVVMIDMDHFKEINDTHGHAAGDYLLKAFADCVRMTLRKTDLAFRYGGDEFLIALPQTPLLMAQQVVNKLRQAFATVDFSDAITQLDHQPTLSVGATERSKTMNLLTLSSLLTAADTALYDAKAANRNCVRTYLPPEAA